MRRGSTRRSSRRLITASPPAKCFLRAVRETVATVSAGERQSARARFCFCFVFFSYVRGEESRTFSETRDEDDDAFRDFRAGKARRHDGERGASGRTVRTTPAACARSEKVSLRRERAWGRQDRDSVSRREGEKRRLWVRGWRESERICRVDHACVVVSPDRRTPERAAQPSERLESSWVSRTRRERVRSAPCLPLSRSSRRRATQRESPGGCPLFARQLFRAMESVRTSANDARARRSCRHRTRSSSRARGDSSRRHRDARAGRPSPPSGPRAAARPARTARVVR